MTIIFNILFSARDTIHHFQFSTMVKSFQAVAMGGTFDEIHAGHIVLLSKAFEEGEKVVIGITSDRFADRTKGKNKINHNYKERVANLKQAINSKFGPVIYEITKLDNNTDQQRSPQR